MASEHTDIFIVAGMPRSGTTYLYHMFHKHPAIFVPALKELDYFSLYYDRGWDWYKEFFAKAEKGRKACDVSPFYFMYEAALDRICERLPDAKVILSVRRPGEFAVSWYKHLLRSGQNVPPFEDFLQRIVVDKPGGSIEFHLAGSRLLTTQIERFCGTLGERLLIYRFDLFEKDPLFVLQAIESFVGLPRFFDSDNLERSKINASDRHESPLLDRILANQWVKRQAVRLVPQGLLLKLRMQYERIKASGANSKVEGGRDESAGDAPSSQWLENAQAALADDELFFEGFFAEGPILLGSGRPFP